MSKTAINTRNGMTDLKDLNPCEFSAENLGETLAKINRYAGRTPEPWSVAAHSVLVSRLCASPEAQAAGLLHDAHEAFIGDIITPAVAFIASQSAPIGEGIIHNCVLQAKAQLDREVGHHWNIAFLFSKLEVAHADRVALHAEMALFFSTPPPDDLSCDVERALEILRRLPTGGNWKTAYELWFNEATELATRGHLQLPQPDNQNSAITKVAV